MGPDRPKLYAVRFWQHLYVVQGVDYVNGSLYAKVSAMIRLESPVDKCAQSLLFIHEYTGFRALLALSYAAVVSS